MLEIDKIAELCITLYNSLPKRGRTLGNEWTVLSCFVQLSVDTGQLSVVALGTGSKCIGASKMSPKGIILNDSHAEVVARRSFLLYLYENINRALDNKSSIFLKVNNEFKLKDNIEFIFYSSQLPCGDASILPKHGEEDLYGDIVQTNKRQTESSCDIDVKKPKTDGDIHRTGAKCLPDAAQDPLEQGAGYHTVGVVRTKPGRGDRTLSVSCSDKLARWIHCGIQGSLLSLLIPEPIYIKHLIFGSGIPFSKESLIRALFDRDSGQETKFLSNAPEIHQSSVVFPHLRQKERIKPAPGSIFWYGVDTFQPEVAIQGIKLGVTKRNSNYPCNALSISKYNMYKKFLEILSKNEELKNHICSDVKLDSEPYNKMKGRALQYLDTWGEVKKAVFKDIWTVKPDMWDFCVELEC